jgi:LPS export ABC transporter protein LptC
MSKINALINEKEAGIEKADSVILTYKENEFLKAEIFGKSVSRYIKNENKLEFTKGIEVRFYENSQLNSILTADFAIYDDIKGIILTKGNVDMYNYKHENLQTDEMEWNMNTKKIVAKHKIKIITPYDVIYGIGMTAKEDFTQYSIKKVTGVVAYNKDDNFR